MDGRHTAGNVMYLCGSIISRLAERGLNKGPFPALGDRICSIALFGSMSTMNFPTDGVCFRRPIEMLRFELGDDEVSDERSDGGGARSGWLYKAGPYEGAEINCWADRSRDAAEGN